MRLFRLAGAVACACVSSPGWCHGHAEELGHHWNNPAYLGEMRLQVAVICGAVCAAVMGSWVSKFRGKRQTRR